MGRMTVAARKNAAVFEKVCIAEYLETRRLLSASSPLAFVPRVPSLTFAQQRSYAPGSIIEGTWDLAAADLNGDGAIDVVTSSFNNQALYVLLNNGNGGFGSPVSINTPGLDSPHAVAVADVSGDGIPDILVGNANSDRVDVFLGVGDGSFRFLNSFSSGTGYVGKIATGDLNGDGHIDLAIGGGRPGGAGSNLAVLVGNGDGTFSPPTTYNFGDGSGGVVIADLNGDGKLDIAVGAFFGNSIDVFRGLGNGDFQPAGSYAAPGNDPSHGAEWLRDVVAGDWNGDGNLDLAAVNNNGAVDVLNGTGGGSFGPAKVYLVAAGLDAVAAADFNGDGKLDLAVTSIGDGTTQVFPGQGDGTFSTPVVLTGTTNQARSIVAADLNGDGSPEIVTGQLDNATLASDSLGVFTNTSGGPDLSLAVNEVLHGILARFNDSGANGGSHTASIDWGDGGRTNASLLQNTDGSYSVSGSHQYKVAGIYTIQITVQDASNDIAKENITALVNTVPSASIHGRAFVDVNYNGVLDTGEAPLGDLQVYLDLNNDGVLDFSEPRTVTSASGTYAFFGLIPGDYVVRQVPPTGYRRTTPTDPAISVEVSGNRSSAAAPFGDVPVPLVQLDFSYLLLMAQHYGTAGTISSGDLDGDDKVGFSDLLILAQRYGHPLST